MASSLIDEAVGKEEFEVFDLCRKLVEKCAAEDSGFGRNVQATAYQHGTDEEQVLKVYQVELRDRVLFLLDLKR